MEHDIFSLAGRRTKKPMDFLLWFSEEFFSGFFTRCAQFFDLLQLLVSGYQRTQTELVFHKHEVFKYLSKRLLDILGEVRLSPLD